MKDRSSSLRTAVILAAGLGSRLLPYTKSCPKCLVSVNGKPILDRAIEALMIQGYEKLVVVTGYQHQMLCSHLASFRYLIDIDVIYNENYATTSNVASLGMALERTDGPFLLMESDLIFDAGLIARLNRLDSIALSRFNPNLHHGTVVTLLDCNSVDRFYVKGPPRQEKPLYKTVNMYSFSSRTVDRLRNRIERLVPCSDTYRFYECILNELVTEGEIELHLADFDHGWWDEVDNLDDLKRVEQKLSEVGAECAL